jgi:chaperonin GroEL
VLRVVPRAGEGGATAAVLAQAILRRARVSVAAGANPVLVRRGIDLGVSAACAALQTQARPVADEAALRALASGTCHDPELSAMLAEMLDILGPEGAVHIVRSSGRGVQAQYIDGARWRARPGSHRTIPAGNTEVTLTDAAVAVADLTLDGWDTVHPLLEAALSLPGRPPLLLVAPGITDRARAMLDANDLRGTLVLAPAVLSTGASQRDADLTDIAVLTGASVIGHPDLPVHRAGPEHFGRARRVLLQRGYLTISGGHGSSDEIDSQATSLRARAHASASPEDLEDDDAQRLWRRQARLTGRLGTLEIGASSTQILDARVASAHKTMRLLRAALREGAVPGGGVAYLDCVPAVQEARRGCAQADEAAGVDAVLSALDAPFTRIVANHGVAEPRVVLHHARERGPGWGFDVQGARFTDMAAAGIRDVTSVLTTALEAAGRTAGVLVTAEVVAGRG